MSKVKFVYTPEGGSRREWVFDPDNPAWDLAYVTEVETGWPWEEFIEKLGRGSHIAMRAIVYAFRKREEMRLSINAVQVTSDELDIEEIEEPESAKPAQLRQVVGGEGQEGDDSPEA